MAATHSIPNKMTDNQRIYFTVKFIMQVSNFSNRLTQQREYDKFSSAIRLKNKKETTRKFYKTFQIIDNI